MTQFAPVHQVEVPLGALSDGLHQVDRISRQNQFGVQQGTVERPTSQWDFHGFPFRYSRTSLRPSNSRLRVCANIMPPSILSKAIVISTAPRRIHQPL